MAIFVETRYVRSQKCKIQDMAPLIPMGIRIQNEETVTEVWLSLMAEGQRIHSRNSNNRGITFGLTRLDSGIYW